MATTSYTNFTHGLREIQGRTDGSGGTELDLPLLEDRMINAILTEGYLSGTSAFQVVADSPASLDVIVGSGTALADLFVVEGDDAGQWPYLVQLKDATVTVTLDPAHASVTRTDEIWLVVRDLNHDATSLGVAQIAYRKGDEDGSASAPGADATWKAAVRLASISVPATATEIVDSGATGTQGEITDQRATSSFGTVLLDSLGGAGSGLDADTLDGVQLASLMGSLEVRESTEVAGAVALTTSYANVASVTLAIPAAWGSWDCEVFAHFAYQNVATAFDLEALVRIDGTDQQAVRVAVNSSLQPMSIGGYRSGMSTTGNRTVSLRVRETSSGGDEVSDIYLYARAVRTS